MQQQKQQSNVVPFVGEFYAASPNPQPEPKPYTNIIALLALALIGGTAIGAISVHQSADYQQLQKLKGESKQLQQLRKSICFGG